MEHKDTLNNLKKQRNIVNQSNLLRKLKNPMLKKFFDLISIRKLFESIKYNKTLQKKMNLNIDYYKDYLQEFSSIELEIEPNEKKYTSFINIKKEDKKYFHIYFNDNKEEIERTALNGGDKVSKINVVIDYQVNSFKDLFQDCFIESINFKNFYRNNITDMSFMFSGCSSLKESNFSNFNTNNVTDMSCMFCECSSLIDINLYSFNTNNVTNMSYMFYGCLSLKNINLDNFNSFN